MYVSLIGSRNLSVVPSFQKRGSQEETGSSKFAILSGQGGWRQNSPWSSLAKKVDTLFDFGLVGIVF